MYDTGRCQHVYGYHFNWRLNCPVLKIKVDRPNLYTVIVNHQFNSKFTAVLDSVLGAELVNETLGIVGFLDDPFLVILPYGTAQLVVIHGRAILPLTPKSCYVSRVFDLEDALGPVQPTDTAPKVLRLEE